MTPLRGPLAIAAGWAAAAGAVAVGGPWLPVGGRWLAVHLFTLGVLSTLLIALVPHFAGTLLHAPARSGDRARLVLWTAAVPLVLIGLTAALPAATAAGGTVLLGVVLWLWRDLRRMRRAAALGGRFVFVARAYERACGAFAHAAVLGVLLGTGVLAGPWYGVGRLAHLHVALLGWGATTLLATAVFLGPTLARTRIVDGADDTAAGALRLASPALTVAGVALLVTPLPEPYGTAARLLAALALTAYAGAATAVCRPVLAAVRQGRPSVSAWQLHSALLWLLAALWLDALVVATGRFDLLGSVVLLVVLGVLAHAILGSLGHLAPLAFGVRPPPAPAEALRAWAPVGLIDLGVGLLVVGGLGIGLAPVAVPAGTAVLVLGAGARGATIVRSLRDRSTTTRAGRPEPVEA